MEPKGNTIELSKFLKYGLTEVKKAHKNIFACLFSIQNTISFSGHEQVCLSGLQFKRYFSHHQAM